VRTSWLSSTYSLGTNMAAGGDIASSGFDSDSQAIGFADTLWDLFFEGSSSIRPFGLAVLDGCAHSTEETDRPF